LLVDTGHRASLTEILDTPAHAFLCSKVDCRSLLNTIDVVLNGGGVISIDLMSHLISPTNTGRATQPPGEVMPHPATSLSRPLSSREVEILRCLTGGASNKLIARHFEIAESTVKIHVKGILRKISVQNRTQAAIWALAQVPPIAALEPHQAHA
jgi:two-component system nitrate/nitrite response regulator NarL